LEKETVRNHGSALVADDCDRRRMMVERTSGSTGAPLAFWRSLRTVRQRYGLYLARHRLWYGISQRDPWGMAGGRQIVNRERERPPYWVWNGAMRQLYISSYHLHPVQARESLLAMKRYGCRYLWGYSSSINALALAAIQFPEAAPTELIVAMSNAEPLLPAHRQNVATAFGCPARESYGQVELVAAAGECENGGLHVFPEFGWIETVDEFDQPSGSAPGQMIATSLLDEDMPLIRYRNGDRGALPEDDANCACGRTLPLLSGLEGRHDDLLYSLDGRPVGRMDPVFKADLAIREAQIIQSPSRAIVVRIVPAPQYSSSDEAVLTREIQARLGAVPVAFELVDRIPRTANGKFRAVIAEKAPKDVI
jgi:phenylacetate-CoA ligase